MRKIGLKKGVALFLLVFVLPGFLAQPFRQEIIAVVSLPQPTAWQSLSMFLSMILVATLAIYAYNLRQRMKELERERYRAEYNMGD